MFSALSRIFRQEENVGRNNRANIITERQGPQPKA